MHHFKVILEAIVLPAHSKLCKECFIGSEGLRLNFIKALKATGREESFGKPPKFGGKVRWESGDKKRMKDNTELRW